MTSAIRLDVHEKRSPLWALAMPGLYLVACLAAIRAVMIDRSDVGVAGILLAVGLLPAFAIPAIFTTRRARLSFTDEGFTIDGRLEKVDDARIERAERGGAVLHLVMRNGAARSFTSSSYREAAELLTRLPPVSAPAGALAV